MAGSVIRVVYLEPLVVSFEPARKFEDNRSQVPPPPWKQLLTEYGHSLYHEPSRPKTSE